MYSFLSGTAILSRISAVTTLTVAIIELEVYSHNILRKLLKQLQTWVIWVGHGYEMHETTVDL